MAAVAQAGPAKARVICNDVSTLFKGWLNFAEYLLSLTCFSVSDGCREV